MEFPSVLFDISSWWDSNYTSLAALLHDWCCVPFLASSRVHTFWLSHYWRCSLDYFIKEVSARILPRKVTHFPSVISRYFVERYLKWCKYCILHPICILLICLFVSSWILMLLWLIQYFSNDCSGINWMKERESKSKNIFIALRSLSFILQGREPETQGGVKWDTWGQNTWIPSHNQGLGVATNFKSVLWLTITFISEFINAI